jgi:ethylene receptor
MFVIRFVNLMEGHIWIESEGPGKGCMAIFIVKLGIPENTSESKNPFLPKANHGQTTFPGLKVLVLDDNGSVKLQLYHS